MDVEVFSFRDTIRLVDRWWNNVLTNTTYRISGLFWPLLRRFAPHKKVSSAVLQHQKIAQKAASNNKSSSPARVEPTPLLLSNNYAIDDSYYNWW